MYPQPPTSHRPTNYFWILIACVALMVFVLYNLLHGISANLNARVEAAPADVATAVVPTAAPRLQLTPSAAASAAAAAIASPTAQSVNALAEVSGSELTKSPATYRSRPVKVHGTIFYLGQLEASKTWVQIVDANNVYVDGQTSDPLPSGVVKGASVDITGIGAGLTSVTASNGVDYDQAYIDPIQKIELAKS